MRATLSIAALALVSCGNALASTSASFEAAGYLLAFEIGYDDRTGIASVAFSAPGNRGRCPLTDVAARHTADRQDNFDIYLPVWLARYNKLIFGALYLAGVSYTLLKWLGSSDA